MPGGFLMGLRFDNAKINAFATLPAMHTAHFNQLIHQQTDAVGMAPGLLERLLQYRWARRMFSRWMQRRIAGVALGYFRLTLSLKGMLAEVCAYPVGGAWADDALIDDAIDCLQGQEQTLLQQRADWLALAQRASIGRDTGLSQALASLISASTDTFEAAQALRWELMEAQADADIVAGRCHRFDSTEDALSFLHTAARA